MYLLLCDFAWKNDCNNVAAKKYEELQGSETGAANMERVLACKFEFMLAKKLYKEVCEEVALLVAKPSQSSPWSLKGVHSLLFNFATEQVESGSTSTAKSLFEAALLLTPRDDDKSLAMTHRYAPLCAVNRFSHCLQVDHSLPLGAKKLH